LYGTVLWTALTLLPPGPPLRDATPLLNGLTWATIGLLALTIAAGGFVAGLHAGVAYNTFPLMDGRLVPDGYGDMQPFVRNLIANIPAVQFNHRVLASLTLLSASGLTIAAWPCRDRLGWRVGFVGAAALVQYALGVTTLLLVVPADLALSHQIGAMVLLTSVLLIAHAIRGAHLGSPVTFHRPGHGQTRQGTPFYDQITPPSAPPPSAPPPSAEDPKP
jgi:cytochrome c oxidase assembly protein subunit 15